MSWQPIATAPKSGEVLVWVKRAGCMSVLVAHQMASGHSIEDHPPIDGGWYYWTGHQFTPLAVQPTHWIPLPAAPQERDQ